MRTSALLVAALAVITLTGCQPDDPRIIPQPEPSTTPLFASEEEALAAAEEAFGAYLLVADQILQDGGTGTERLLDVATKAALEAELEGYADFVDNKWRSSGSSFADSIALQSYAPESVESIVTIYACIDISEVDVLDQSGVSVVTDGRPNRTPFEVAFDRSGASDLLVASKTVWSGEDFCSQQ